MKSTNTQIGQDIEEAALHAKRTEREYEKARKKYLEILVLRYLKKLKTDRQNRQ